MSVSEGLKLLAQKVEEESDAILAEAEHDPVLFGLTLDIIAGTIHRLAEASKDLEGKDLVVTTDTLDTIAYLAGVLDESEDEVLRKKASMLDELLVTISSPKSVIAQARQQTEDELNKLRAKYRSKTREDIYHNRYEERTGPMKEAIREAVADQVKDYRAMEAPLQTRYCPDHPGVGMVRIAERVFQCALDKKLYNYESGYTTMKGSKIPGGGVEYQAHDMEQRDPGHSIFDTRQSMMARFANKDYEYGFGEGAGGKKVIEVRWAGPMSDQRKQMILDEINSTYGSQYPVIFAPDKPMHSRVSELSSSADNKKKV